MSKKTYSELTIEKLQAKSIEKYGIDKYFTDDATIYQIEALISQYPILKCLNYENMSLSFLLSKLTEILKHFELTEFQEENESLSIYFDVASDVKFISGKEILLTVLFLLVFKNKVDNVKLYFYSKSDNIINFPAAMKSCDFIETETYKFTSRVSFSISEFLQNNYEKNTIADSHKNIKAKYTNR
jgi:hypothetical protein